MSEQSRLSEFGTNSESQTDSFECKICGRSFDSNTGRGIHRGSAHSDAEIKQVMLAEIQQLADELGRTPNLQHMNDIGKFSTKTYQRKFGSWNAALEESGLEINKERNITDQELLDELRRLSEEIGETPTSRDMEELGKYGSSSYVKSFGTWNNAVRQAGIKIGRQHDIPEADLIDEIQRLADELGHPPTANHMRDRGCFGVSTISDEFGTWNDALIAAGFEPNKVKNVDKGKLTGEIRRLDEEYGRPPTAKDMERDGAYSVGTFTRAFESWNGALSAAGFDPHNRTNIPNEELLAELKRLSDGLNRTPRAVDMEAKGKFSYKIYQQKFGSWNAAIREVHLEVNVRSDIPKSELIQEIHSLRSQLERTPERREMDQYGRFDSTTYMAEFGGWNEALKQADLEPIRHSDISESQLIDEMKRLADDLNRPPTGDEMIQQGKFSCSIYGRKFGTWTNALLEAGLDPHKTLYPDYLDHEVRSQNELQIADLLVDAGIDYEYESLVIEYGDGRTYTPDFITNEYVIEVKGVDFGKIYNKPTTAKQKAEAAMEQLENRNYVVVGVELPADIHISWNERAKLRRIFERETS